MPASEQGPAQALEELIDSQGSTRLGFGAAISVPKQQRIYFEWSGVRYQADIQEVASAPQ